ncbi:hypothetical protein F5884DRAFT_860135 [Xylogone sp. PMI_703]|nr:hypothetical protein F5884DRAFT_860135 [Xylogone sp. PMI_703]
MNVYNGGGHPPADPAPDIMNDPQFTTNTGGSEDGGGEPDTCRICRGEATEKEPLFYPCKCSGSIKFVHQNCLMDWLSHSQKKHCELCKTPFRFTKLYSPKMPRTLPTDVFLRQFALHVAKNMTVWARACLVITVWLVLLPYLIRQFWRFLFWFSDGGWPSSKYNMISTTINTTVLHTLKKAAELQLAYLAANGTSPVTPLAPIQTSPASLSSIINKLGELVAPISQNFNLSNVDPLAAGFFESLSYTFGLQNRVIPLDAFSLGNVSQLFVDSSTPLHSTSLLSDVPFLKNLTRSAEFNQLVVTVAEGYIISILVVVCFILVFLIREWVVQQQPGINMGAGFNADAAAAVGRPWNPPNAQENHQQAAPEVQPEAPQRPADNAQERNVLDVDQRPIARPRRRIGNLPRENQANQEVNLAQPGRVFDPSLYVDLPDLPQHAEARRRQWEILNREPQAIERQRWQDDSPRNTEEFMSIWRRADGDLEEILRIIERENLGDQMRYWVNAIQQRLIMSTAPLGSTRPPQRRLNELTVGTGASQDLLSTSNNSRSDASEQGSAMGINWRTPRTTEATSSRVKFDMDSSTMDSFLNDQKTHTEAVPSSSSSGSWVDIPEIPLNTNSNLDAENTIGSADEGSTESNPEKGKGKAKEIADEPLYDSTNQVLSTQDWLSSQSTENLRRRAISDGPQRKDNISLLGSNNWSFSNLAGVDEPPHDTPKQTTEEAESFSPSANVEPTLSTANQPEQDNVVPTSRSDPTVDQPPDEEGQDPSSNSLNATHPVSSESTPMPVEDEGHLEIQGQDGVVRGYSNWDEVFAANPVHETDSDAALDGSSTHGATEANPFAPETPLPEPREPNALPVNEPQGLMARVADWLWGAVGDNAAAGEQGGNDEQVVEDLGAEAPFVPVAQLNPDNGDNAPAPQQDREVVEAAIAAGIDPNDPDAIDDAEDFEGIMELIGMRGPIFGLIQNALFSAFLLALTVAFGVWIPYSIGRITVLLIANPGPTFKLPLRLIYGSAAFIQDMAVAALGVLAYCLVLPVRLWGLSSGNTASSLLSKCNMLSYEALRISNGATDRILDGTITMIVNVAESDMFTFSAASHEALLTIKSTISQAFITVGQTFAFICCGNYNITFETFRQPTSEFLQLSSSALSTLLDILARPNSWVISFEVTPRSIPLDPQLSIWDGVDRFWATLIGYVTLTTLGALYIHKGSPFSTSQAGREWEATLLDVLNQAGGVMKVILIISIEMLVFPLYCGLLLDAALLPLFDNASIMSRIQFTLNSPLTSIFVHWFVGTCYMFHFALFVSMCRKIMRKGVLYFIRDPDDPTFHPVRDVLERNVATQLRKIAFSALVYGALVVICLGGVVWGLAYSFKGVLPIQWSSNEPVLEFPVDLLFYNFLMPLAVKFFKPSDGLHAMYDWWFHQCARMLRLTWFMFGERREDEEGYAVRRRWRDIFHSSKAEVTYSPQDVPEKVFQDNPDLNVYFCKDGKYVRAPASDQVRIPKGTDVFLEVNENNDRVDGKWDRPDGLHGRTSDSFKQVYIPPWFRVRIFLFILFIWLFAAATGLGITIVPLVFGRQIFARIIPSHVKKNDVYAFSIGIYILGSALYILLHLRQGIRYAFNTLFVNGNTPQQAIRRATAVGIRVAKVVWTHMGFIIILPTLLALVVEFYFIIPIHTYWAPEEQHTIHFVQSWTLGLLYVKLTSHVILWYENSRPAEALRAITRDGYLNPDARLATRSFILPGSVVLSSAILVPWLLASFMAATVYRSDPEQHKLLFRFSYPAVLFLGILIMTGFWLRRMLQRWQQKIKDEVYLIGERLHNFSGNTKSGGVPGHNTRRIDA